MIGHNLAVAYRPKLVDVGRLTLRAALDDTLARIVVAVGLFVAIDRGKLIY